MWPGAKIRVKPNLSLGNIGKTSLHLKFIGNPDLLLNAMKFEIEVWKRICFTREKKKTKQNKQEDWAIFGGVHQTLVYTINNY